MPSADTKKDRGKKKKAKLPQLHANTGEYATPLPYLVHGYFVISSFKNKVNSRRKDFSLLPDLFLFSVFFFFIVPPYA